MFNSKQKKIDQLTLQLREANELISELMHKRKCDAKVLEEVERRHEAELKVASSKYGETFSSKPWRPHSKLLQ